MVGRNFPLFAHLLQVRRIDENGDRSKIRSKWWLGRLFRLCDSERLIDLYEEIFEVALVTPLVGKGGSGRLL